MPCVSQTLPRPGGCVQGRDAWCGQCLGPVPPPSARRWRVHPPLPSAPRCSDSLCVTPRTNNKQWKGLCSQPEEQPEPRVYCVASGALGRGPGPSQAVTVLSQGAVCTGVPGRALLVVLDPRARRLTASQHPCPGPHPASQPGPGPETASCSGSLWVLQAVSGTLGAALIKSL